MPHKFMIANSRKGPWLDLGEYDTSHKAFDAAKAQFTWGHGEWTHIYIARMRQMEAPDILPPQQIFWSDLRERIVEQHGHDVLMILEESGLFDSQEIWIALDDAILEHLTNMETQLWVPEVIDCYDSNGRPVPGYEWRLATNQQEADPNPKKPGRVSIKDLMRG